MVDRSYLMPGEAGMTRHGCGKVPFLAASCASDLTASRPHQVRSAFEQVSSRKDQVSLFGSKPQCSAIRLDRERVLLDGRAVRPDGRCNKQGKLPAGGRTALRSIPWPRNALFASGYAEKNAATRSRGGGTNSHLDAIFVWLCARRAVYNGIVLGGTRDWVPFLLIRRPVAIPLCRNCRDSHIDPCSAPLSD